MSKKAQGLSMNIIIIAAIALLVLVILAILFIGRTGIFAKGVDECKGQCIEDDGSANPCASVGTYYKPNVGDCPEDKPVCCIGV